jgi:hypothetical protein
VRSCPACRANGAPTAHTRRRLEGAASRHTTKPRREKRSTCEWTQRKIWKTTKAYLAQGLQLLLLPLVIHVHRLHDCARRGVREHLGSLGHMKERKGNTVVCDLGTWMIKIENICPGAPVRQAPGRVGSFRGGDITVSMLTKNYRCRLSERSDRRLLIISKILSRHVYRFDGPDIRRFFSTLFSCRSALVVVRCRLSASPSMHLMYTIDEQGNRIYTLKVNNHSFLSW